MGGIRVKVEKIFTVPGRGVVVSGKIEEGRVAVGQAVGFQGTDGQWTEAKVMAIEVAHRLVEEAQGEQKASLLLEGLKKKQVGAGTILLEPPSSPVSTAASERRKPYEDAATIPLPPHPEIALPPDVSRGGAIQPSSGLWRTAFFLFLGALLILGLLYFQGRWEPIKRRTEVRGCKLCSWKKVRTLPLSCFFNFGDVGPICAFYSGRNEWKKLV
jgi:hypothetical protein